MIAMKFYELTLGILAVWRLTHLLAAEDGPFHLIVRLRRAAGSGFWGSLMDCFYCLSAWIAIPFAILIGNDWRERLLLWPALSGAAILVNRFANGINPEAPVFFEDPPAEVEPPKEEYNELLRKVQSTS